ncbi:hypothetical protein GGR56DRAFT_616277 [Xylariaceae sp. FL0804]|nr:hypothetical protein GGR56DRAFT_616277 [Xylariaceae sp. FL0804]
MYDSSLRLSSNFARRTTLKMGEHTLTRSGMRKLTYTSLHINDHTLDDRLPGLESPPEQGHFCLPPTKDIGALDDLPPELVAMILSELDLRTLTDFRCVNRRAAELVNSLVEYKAITTHAQNALRDILSIEAGRGITCRTLYDKLCTPNCEQCGDFGSYLYLLTCKRLCFFCFYSILRKIRSTNRCDAVMRS